MNGQLIDITTGPGGGSGPAAESVAISPERFRAAIEGLRAFKDSSELPWSEIAPQIGADYAESTISVFASGKYALKNSRNVVEAVEQFLALVEERRSLITQPQFVETSVAKLILALTRKIVLLMRMGVLAADSGVGKSTTLQQYQLRYPRTIYLRANPTWRPRNVSVTPILHPLLRSLDYQQLKANSVQTHGYDYCVAKLKGTERLLIVDEAQYCPSEGLNVLRALHEDAGIPILLAGNEAMYTRGPAGFITPAEFTQFESRCLRERLSARDITGADVDLIAEQILEVDLARDASSILLEQAQGPGGFRRLVIVLQVAQLLRRSASERIAKAHVVRALHDLSGNGSRR